MYTYSRQSASCASAEGLRQAATVNTVDDFRYVFSKAFEGLVIERMEGNEEIFSKLMSDEEFRKMASEHLLHKVYSSINQNKDKDATVSSE